jgi:outer membrane murein-binding lipoprotein Lpp
MLVKSVIPIILTIIILAGCTSNEIAVLREENDNLKEENWNLNHKNNQLDNEVKNKLNAIEELKKENKSVNELLNELLKKPMHIPTSEIIMGKEGFFVEPEVIFPDEISIQKIKKLLGEPTEIKEYIEEAHCGCKEIEVTYDHASFTFQIPEDKEAIKWMTIKAPFFTTQRGITIGSTKEQVIKAYGENYDYWKLEDRITYGEKTGIGFTFVNNRVSEIQIWYMYE